MVHPIEALTTAYADAVFAKDAKRLAALYAPDVRVFDAWSVWSYEGRPAWCANLELWLGSLGEGRVRVSFDDVAASAIGDMGFLSAIVTYADVDAAGATRKSLQNRLTWILMQTDGAWAIAHEHTSAPIGDDGKAMLRRD